MKPLRVQKLILFFLTTRIALILATGCTTTNHSLNQSQLPSTTIETQNNLTNQPIQIATVIFTSDHLFFTKTYAISILKDGLEKNKIFISIDNRAKWTFLADHNTQLCSKVSQQVAKKFQDHIQQQFAGSDREMFLLKWLAQQSNLGHCQYRVQIAALNSLQIPSH